MTQEMTRLSIFADHHSGQTAATIAKLAHHEVIDRARGELERLLCQVETLTAPDLSQQAGWKR